MKKITLTLLALSLLISLVAFSACSSSGTSATTASATPAASSTAASSPAASTKIMQWSSAPAMTIDKNKEYMATIKAQYGDKTGDIVIRLLPQEAPLAVNNFVFLARQGFYDGVNFHRIVAGFVIQGGDPTGTGSGGPGYKFADEEISRDYVKGTLAMANSGSDTNGSQFFITLDDLAGLPKKYTIFGLVSGGQDVVDAIAQVPVKANPRMNGEMSSPTVDVHMISVTIEEK